MSKKRILIVEDEALTVLALKHELAELGYEIAGDANTAADALRGAEDNRADLVLMDIQLDGGISGVAASAAIRGHLDIPVVFLTAHASAETLARAVESGAFGYLLKPYTAPELKAAIDIALHKHKTESAMRGALSSPVADSVTQAHSTSGALQGLDSSGSPVVWLANSVARLSFSHPASLPCSSLAPKSAQQSF